MKLNKVLIVGASGGIGSAVALALAQNGYNSALMGRNRASLVSIADTCIESGGNAFPIVCDIAHTSTIKSAVSEAIEILGGLNFLINCAGVSNRGALHETDLDQCDAILDTNLRAHYYLARFALEEINKQPGGAVIKIGSVNFAYPGVNLYLAATQGIDGYAAALFEDVREFGTKICTIKPGYVNTELVRSDNLDSALMIQPEDISRTILYLLSMPGTACPTEIVILPQRSPYKSV